MRPEQWLKNGFVLAPIVFSGLIFDSDAWLRILLAAAAFCAASSATYLINDVIDREADRAHPVKRQRPIAAGAVSPAAAGSAAAVLVSAAVAVAVGLGGWFPLVLIGYVVLVLLYSAVLKHAVFLDVLVVAAGFVLRVVGGAVAIEVPVSRWLLLVTYLGKYPTAARLADLRAGTLYQPGDAIGSVLPTRSKDYMLHFAIGYGATWELELRTNPNVPLNAGATWIQQRYVHPIEYLGQRLEPQERHPKLVNGHDLMRLGLRPGPRFRQLLTAVEEAQWEGLVQTREEALDLVRRLL